MTGGRYVDCPRIVRVDGNSSDVPGLFEAGFLPGSASSRRTIDAIAPGTTLAIVRLAGSGPYDRVIGRRDGYRADGQHTPGPVEDGDPGNAFIDALENAARCGRDV